MNRRALLALAACVWGTAAADPRLRIELLPEVEIAQPAVRLGDVAHLRSPELALLRQLVDLPIGRVPGAGSEATLRRDALTAWLRQQAALAPTDIAWEGAEATHVRQRLQTVTGEAIAQSAVAALRARLAAAGIPGQVDVHFVPHDVTVPAGDLRLQPRPLASVPAWRRSTVWVDLFSGGRFLRSVPVGVEVEGGLGQAGPLSGAAMPRSPSSAPLAAIPLVARGQWATLRSGAGAVTLESHVEVLQDGRAGQRVRVRAAGATGIVFARVLGPAQLELVP